MSNISFHANKNLITAPENSSASDVAAMMDRHNIGAVVIIDSKDSNSKIIGMVTERTICRRIVGSGGRCDAPVADLIETNVPRMAPETTIQEAVEAMRQAGSRYLFITGNTGNTGKDDQVTGVLSMQDLIRALSSMCELEAEALRKYVSGDPHP